MFSLLIYILLSVELLLVGCYYVIQWKINKRRSNDIYICIIACFFSISYFMTGILFFPINNVDYLKLYYDVIIAIALGIYFIHKIITDIKKFK